MGRDAVVVGLSALRKSRFVFRDGGGGGINRGEAREKYVHLYLENLVFFRHFRRSDGL